MSAVLKGELPLARMREADLAEVLALESAIYSHPWTRGNFADSLRTGYECWTWRHQGGLVGYFILLVAAGESHLLNLSIAAVHQRQGCGSAVLREVMRMARKEGGRQLFLEVRPSNLAAQGLYQKFGFRQVGVRKGYYPAEGGREDALVLELGL